MYVQSLARAVPYRIPYAREKFLTPDNSARLLCEHRQKIELLRRQVNELPIDSDPTPRAINIHPTGADWRFDATTTTHRAYTCT
jgi:hypothetical protein